MSLRVCVCVCERESACVYVCLCLCLWYSEFSLRICSTGCQSRIPSVFFPHTGEGWDDLLQQLIDKGLDGGNSEKSALESIYFMD